MTTADGASGVGVGHRRDTVQVGGMEMEWNYRSKAVNLIIAFIIIEFIFQLTNFHSDISSLSVPFHSLATGEWEDVKSIDKSLNDITRDVN